MTLFKTAFGFALLLTFGACAPMTDQGEIIKDSENVTQPAPTLAQRDCLARCASKHAGAAQMNDASCKAACER